MPANAPIILWFRRDLRLHDHPMLHHAAQTGRPVIPVFILDEQTKSLGAAAKWRLGLALDHFDQRLRTMGGQIIFRQGEADEILPDLCRETRATSVYWSRLYDAPARRRDDRVAEALAAQRLEHKTFGGFLIFEPDELRPQQGGYYRIYTPYWRGISRMMPAPYVTAPQKLTFAPPPCSEQLTDWQMGAQMRRGAEICLPYQHIGEERALLRLDHFIDTHLGDYPETRDLPAQDATSHLSENLTYGEISPRLIWHKIHHLITLGTKGAERFLQQLVWREFAWHLMYHTPHMAHSAWKPEWQNFPWEENPHALTKWQRGQTGEPFVDAAMRQMYVTGKMHNRARMIAASYLTKHLLVHWRHGMAWFEQCLTDWDSACNAMGWQWVAGCGPDAAPYFRIFNPALQAQKFDPNNHYRHGYIAEQAKTPSGPARDYFNAIPLSWHMSPDDIYPARIIKPDQGRARALAAYERFKTW